MYYSLKIRFHRSVPISNILPPQPQVCGASSVYVPHLTNTHLTNTHLTALMQMIAYVLKLTGNPLQNSPHPILVQLTLLGNRIGNQPIYYCSDCLPTPWQPATALSKTKGICCVISSTANSTIFCMYSMSQNPSQISQPFKVYFERREESLEVPWIA